MRVYKAFAYLALLSLLLQVALIFVSWLLTAAYPELGVRSLLGGEGVRWFVGRFVDNLTSAVLVWILLLSVSFGTFVGSGLYGALRSIGGLVYRERLALRFVAVELVLFLASVLMLTVVPHAVLLNVTGNIWPSSFSSGIVPMMAFVLCVCSVTYGLMVGRLRSVIDVFRLLAHGVSVSSPLFVVYILLAGLYHSVCFVFEF